MYIEARLFQAKCWITFTQGHMTWQLYSLPSSCVLLYLTPLKKFTINHFTKYLSRIFLEHLNQNFHWGIKHWLKMQSVTFSNFKLKTHLHLISVHFMHWLTLFYFLTNDKNSTYLYISPMYFQRDIFLCWQKLNSLNQCLFFLKPKIHKLPSIWQTFSTSRYLNNFYS